MKKTIHIILLFVLVAVGTSCSSKKGDDPVAPVGTAGPVTQDGTGATPTNCTSSNSSGNTVCFSMASFSTFVSYVATHPLNDPSNVQLSVQLSDVGNGRFGGTVQISYTDNNTQFNGIFNSSSGVNSDIGGNRGYNGFPKSEFNYWFTFEGRRVFTGFFQDQYGAIVLVIENTLDTGDGSGGGFLTGSVWYRNFAQGLASYNNTERHCWFLSDGPYNCQSSIVMSKSGLFPTDTYQKLGTFSGLSKSAAFGN